jgi:glycosyltransferase involved in cell wall biosynthesis
MYVHQLLVDRAIGGAALIALRLAEFLRGRGEPNAVWIPERGPAYAEANRLGIEVQEYDGRWAFARGVVQSALCNMRLGRQLARFGPGIVHVHGPVWYGAFRRGLGYSGLKRVVHVHLEGDAAGLQWAFQSLPELIVTCARFLEGFVRDTLPEPHRERQRIEAVPNAVDVERFRPGDRAEAKARVGAPRDMPLALMLANLSPHKGQETALRAITLLRRRGVDVACWMAGVERGGTSDYTARLEGLIRQYGVADRVKLLGQRPDAPDLLRAADFLLLPSTCEGLPLSILEAQATKTLVLAASTAGVPEIVTDGITGFLIPADEPAGYARCMEDLLANPGLRELVTDAAQRKVVRDHNWQAYCERMWALYRELSRATGPHAMASSVA